MSSPGEYGERFARMFVEAMKPRPCDGCDLDGPPGVHFPPPNLLLLPDGTAVASGDVAQLRAAAVWLERHKRGGE
jgi:hypothetical protein